MVDISKAYGLNNILIEILVYDWVSIIIETSRE
jgi:hypothetical protein